MDQVFKSGKSETKPKKLDSTRLKEEIAEELLKIFAKSVARDKLGEGDVGPI